MELSTDSQMVLHLTLVKKATVKERRRFFKADCGKECVIKILQRDDEAFDIHPQINGTIVNINLGGVLISAESKFEFAIDDIITIEMPDMLGSKAVFNVKVLRCVRSPDGERVDIGCCFIGVDPRTEGEIARYINILQREKILEEKAKAELEL
jgi:c-di-GMP-binding flagellar brake protein YcgR